MTSSLFLRPNNATPMAPINLAVNHQPLPMVKPDHDLSELHQANFLKILASVSSNKTFNTFVNGFSAVSLVSLFTSSFANLYNPDSNSIGKIFIDKLADFTNKGFQFFNALKNVCKLVPNRDYLNAFGHLTDTIMPFFVSMKNFYISRGLPLGLYSLATATNVINERSIFKNLPEHLDHLKQALSKTIMNFKTDPMTLIKRLGEPHRAMMGVLAFVFSVSGFFLNKPLEMLWGQKGRGFAAILRDIGGTCQSLEGMKPGHFSSGRVFWGLSAYSQLAGVISHGLSETLLNRFKKALDPLSLAFSGLNRWLFRISNERDESGLANKAFNRHNIKQAFSGAFKN